MNSFPPRLMHGVSLMFVDLAENLNLTIFWLVGADVVVRRVCADIGTVPYKIESSFISSSGEQIMLGWFLAIVISFSPTVSRADDGNLQRALLEAACANAKISRLPSVSGTELYEANCFGTPHKRIKIVCTSGRCVADRPQAGRDYEDEQD